MPYDGYSDVGIVTCIISLTQCEFESGTELENLGHILVRMYDAMKIIIKNFNLNFTKSVCHNLDLDSISTLASTFPEYELQCKTNVRVTGSAVDQTAPPFGRLRTFSAVESHIFFS